MSHHPSDPEFPHDGESPDADPFEVVDGGDEDAPESRRSPSRRSFLALAGVGIGAAAVGAAVPILGRELRSTTPSAGGVIASDASASASAATPAAAASSSTPGLADITSEHLTITVADGYRTIKTQSLPDHAIDANYRYVATPSAQKLEFRVTTTPAVAAQPTQVVTGQVFGVDLDSVVFDPTTAGYYNQNRNSGWNENADRLDRYGAHTRPDGFYHYHQVTDAWVSDPTRHSTLVGWAADGFPIYLRYGYGSARDATSSVKNLAASYRLKTGSRPSGGSNPGGTYDGTYVADYEFVDGLGDLDQCNGRWCVTPEFPDGTYAYFLTDQWPYIPHWIRGTPDASFAPGFGGGSGPMSGGNGRQAPSQGGGTTRSGPGASY